MNAIQIRLSVLALLVLCGCSANQDSPEVTLEKANIQWQRGNFEEAIRFYDDAIRSMPQHDEAHYRRGDCYWKLGLHKQAIEGFDTCLEINPQYYDALNDKGVCLAQTGQFEAATEVFGQLINVDNNNGLAYRNRGLCLFDMQQFEAAIADYDRAIACDSEDAESWFQKGNAQLQINRFQEAINNYTEAIKREPEFAKAWMNRGLARYRLGERKEAMAELHHASELDNRIVIPAIDWENVGIPESPAAEGNDVVVVARPVVPAIELWSLVEMAAKAHLRSQGYTALEVNRSFGNHHCCFINATHNKRSVRIYVAVTMDDKTSVVIPAIVDDTTPTALLVLAPKDNAATTDDVSVKLFDPSWNPQTASTAPVLLKLAIP